MVLTLVYLAAQVRQNTKGARRSATAEAKRLTMVEALHQPEAYPGNVASVDLAETPIFYLFLTDQQVYKLKKPAHACLI